MPAPPTTNESRTWLATLSTIVGLVGLFLLLWTLWRGDLVQQWKDSASPLRFFLAMAIVPAFGMPLTPFFIAAGTAFGVRVGIIGSLLAICANYTITYWVARTLLRPWIGRFMKRRGYETPGEKGTSPLRLTAVVKMTPGLPAFMKNYILGAAGVPFATYLVVSMIVSGVYGVALVVLGEAVFQHDVNHAVVIAALVVVVPIAIWIWRRLHDVGGPHLSEG